MSHVEFACESNRDLDFDSNRRYVKVYRMDFDVFASRFLANYKPNRFLPRQSKFRVLTGAKNRSNRSPFSTTNLKIQNSIGIEKLKDIVAAKSGAGIAIMYSVGKWSAEK